MHFLNCNVLTFASHITHHSIKKLHHYYIRRPIGQHSSRQFKSFNRQRKEVEEVAKCNALLSKTAELYLTPPSLLLLTFASVIQNLNKFDRHACKASRPAIVDFAIPSLGK